MVLPVAIRRKMHRRERKRERQREREKSEYKRKPFIEITENRRNSTQREEREKKQRHCEWDDAMFEVKKEDMYNI